MGTDAPPLVPAYALKRSSAEGASAEGHRWQGVLERFVQSLPLLKRDLRTEQNIKFCPRSVLPCPVALFLPAVSLFVVIF
jgi:hypothetical protein